MTLRSRVRDLVLGSRPTTEVARFSPFEQFPGWPVGGAYGGLLPYSGFTMSTLKAEPVEDTYMGYVLGAYRANGVVFGVSVARALLLSEATFKFRRRGTVGGGNDLFGTQALGVLETPWPGGTTQDLIMRMEQDTTAAGTAFVAREEGPDGPRLRRLRPDWVEFVLSAPPAFAVDSDVVGFKYTVGGPAASGGETRFYTRDEVAYWAPIPDPTALYRGMSWLTPVIKEMQADGAATAHKLKFFENAATPNLAVSFKETVTPEQFRQFKEVMNESHRGLDKAYETLFLGGGADVTVVGADLRQLDFSSTQGHGETRICAAGRVPPIIVGVSEGLQAATYSNYGQARRAFGDHWGRPTWRSLCGALAVIVDVPANAQLWYDDRDIAFLREDRKDFADIQATNAGTISTLIAAGYTPDSTVQAVLTEDFSVLEHTGLFSVQLQPPADPTATADDPGVIAPADDPGVTPDVTDPAATADQEGQPG